MSNTIKITPEPRFLGFLDDHNFGSIEEIL